MKEWVAHVRLLIESLTPYQRALKLKELGVSVSDEELFELYLMERPDERQAS